MKYPVVPAIIPESYDSLRSHVANLRFSNEIQLDLVDGQFVETSSWPYDPSGEPKEVAKLFAPFTLEVDLMVTDPLPAARKWLAAGADMLVFHVETLSLSDFATFAETTKISLGVSAHGDTPLETLLEYAAVADYVQLMGIHEIGAQGQPFDESVLEKVTVVKQTFPDQMLSVDGSVNKDTIVRLRDAGVDRFVVGSAIVLQDDPQTAHRELCALVND